MKKQITFLDKNNRRFHITIEINNGKFSMTGQSEGSFGQLVDDIEPDNAYQKQLVSMWHKYHLNDMKAGTPEQEEALKSERFKVWKENMSKLVAEAKRIEGLAKSTDVIEYARKLGKLKEEGVSADGNKTYSYPSILHQELRDLRKTYMNKMLGNVTVGHVLKSMDSSYEMACLYLKSISLYSVQLNGEPYRYGTKWLKQELPADIQSKVDDLCEKIEWLEKSKPAYVPPVKVMGLSRIKLTLPSMIAEVSYSANGCKAAKAPWNKDTEDKVYKYKVYVRFDKVGEDLTNPEDCTISFDFYGSISDFEEGKKMEGKDLANALRCHIQDAHYAYMDIDQFADEMGYTKPSEVVKVYRACESALGELNRIGFDEDTICNVLNEMSNENIG